MEITNKNGEYVITFSYPMKETHYCATCTNDLKEMFINNMRSDFDKAIRDGISETKTNNKQETNKNNYITIRWREQFETLTKILIENGYTLETCKFNNGFLIKIIR